MDAGQVAGLVQTVTRQVLAELNVPGPDDIPVPQLPDLPDIDPTRPGRTAPGLRIEGVEPTQSTQYADTTTPHYGDTNGVPLVALKKLAVRVSAVPTAGLLAPGRVGARITGELVVSAWNKVIYRTGPTRADGARVGPQSRIVRSAWDEEVTFASSAGADRVAAKLIQVNSPLNFEVPAWYCRAGNVRLAVRIWYTDEVGGSDAWDDLVYFTDVGAPRLCLVRVNWTDASGNRTSPSDADMLSSLGIAERMLPFPYFETTILTSEIESSAAFGAVPSSPGACNGAWNSLVADLAVTSIFTGIFGLGNLVVGFVPPAALPAKGPYVAGCGRGGVGTFVNQPLTVAHELGHLYGRSHVAVPGDASSDPNYPNYGGDPRSIGEVGIDTGTRPPTLYDPSSTDDLMSYPQKPNQWISPYTYRAILDARGRHPSAPASVPRPLLVLATRLYRDRTVAIRRAIRVDAPGQVDRQWDGATSPLSVDVLDGNRQVLHTHHLLHVAARGCGCGGCGGGVPAGREAWLDFEDAIEWPEGASALAFHDGGEPLLVVQAGEPPTLEVSEPTVEDGALRLRVVARHRSETPSVMVLFTGDGGETWWPIAFDPGTPEVSVPVASLPSRGRSRVRVIATAELVATTVDTQDIDLPASGRRVHLELPDHACGIEPGPVLLRARVDLQGTDRPAPHDVTWRSSLDGDLGSGYELEAELQAGEHQISVSLPDGVGGTLTERGIIIVGG